MAVNIMAGDAGSEGFGFDRAYVRHGISLGEVNVDCEKISSAFVVSDSLRNKPTPKTLSYNLILGRPCRRGCYLRPENFFLAS